MEIYFSILFQVICSVFLLGLLGSSWKYLRCRLGVRAAPLVDLVFFFSSVKIALYYLLPAVLRAVSGMRFELEASREPLVISQVYGIEALSWVSWLLPFFIYAFFGGKKVAPDVGHDYLRIDYSKYFLWFLVVGFVFTRVQLVVLGEVTGLLIAFQSVFSFTGKAAGPLLFVLAIKYFDKKSFALGMMGTIFGIASYGTRGALVYTLLLLLFCCFFLLKSRLVNKIMLISFVCILVSYFALGGLVGVSYSVADDGKIEISTGLNERKLNELSAIEKIEDRFGAPTRIGSAFIDMYERGDSANGAPILNSALGLVPRAFNPDKPHPNTLVGNDLYSQGMYLIFREVYGYSTSQMVEFPTGGHFYWQFGYAGVVALSILSGIYILLSILFYSRFGLVGVAFLFACFKPWGYVDPKIWCSDIVLQLYQVVLPTIVLIVLSKIFFVRLGAKRRQCV